MEPNGVNDARTAYWASDIQRMAPDWDRLREAGEQIASLVEHPGWAVLCELVRGKIDRLHADVLPPVVRQHAEYIGLTSQEYSFHRLLEAPEAVRLVVQREDEKQRRAAELAAAREERR